jgi:GxxExxY protein
MTTKKYLDELTYKIIGCAIEVHKALGPGLLENIYERCLLQELKLKNLSCTSQQSIPLEYKGIVLDCELRYDILVEDIIIVELKAVNDMHPIFEAQLLTYMKLLQKPKGILINFNCSNIFKDGQKTFVNQYFRNLPE